MALDHAEIDRRFALHTPTDPAANEKLDELRAQYIALAQSIAALTPGNREQSLAVTSLEESLYWAIGAVVRPPAVYHQPS